MRRLAAATLALPVLASIYLAAFVAVLGARRSLAAISAVLVVGVFAVSIGLLSPGGSSSGPASHQIASGGPAGNTARSSPSSSAASPGPQRRLAVSSLPDPARNVLAGTRVSEIGPVDAIGRGPLLRPAHASSVIAAGRAPAPIAATRPVVRPLTAPALLTFLPITGTSAVGPTTPISVRFSLPMDRVTTARAFALTVGGARVTGTFSWAAHDTVLVFRPSAALPPGSVVGIRVTDTATAADGRRLTRGASAILKVATAHRTRSSTRTPVKRPAIQPHQPTPVLAPKPRPIRKPIRVGRTSGPIAGIDVSHHDGPIDWPAVAAAGTTFAYLKASEGTRFVDPTYAANRADAEAAGILVGAFHYAQPDASAGEAAAEADHFVATATFRKGELTPMLDLEVTNGLSPAALQAWVAGFLDRVYQRTGVRAGIYVSPSFWQTYLADTPSIAAAGYGALWIADWTAAATPWVPASDWGGMGWAFWQYDHRAHVSGVAGPVDVDHFSGSDLAALRIR